MRTPFGVDGGSASPARAETRRQACARRTGARPATAPPIAAASSSRRVTPSAGRSSVIGGHARAAASTSPQPRQVLAHTRTVSRRRAAGSATPSANGYSKCMVTGRPGPSLRARSEERRQVHDPLAERDGVRPPAPFAFVPVAVLDGDGVTCGSDQPRGRAPRTARPRSRRDGRRTGSRARASRPRSATATGPRRRRRRSCRRGSGSRPGCRSRSLRAASARSGGASASSVPRMPSRSSYAK